MSGKAHQCHILRLNVKLYHFHNIAAPVCCHGSLIADLCHWSSWFFHVWLAQRCTSSATMTIKLHSRRHYSCIKAELRIIFTRLKQAVHWSTIVYNLSNTCCWNGTTQNFGPQGHMICVKYKIIQEIPSMFLISSKHRQDRGSLRKTGWRAEVKQHCYSFLVSLVVVKDK